MGQWSLSDEFSIISNSRGIKKRAKKLKSEWNGKRDQSDWFWGFFFGDIFGPLRPPNQQIRCLRFQKCWLPSFPTRCMWVVRLKTFGCDVPLAISDLLVHWWLLLMVYPSILSHKNRDGGDDFANFCHISFPLYNNIRSESRKWHQNLFLSCLAINFIRECHRLPTANKLINPIFPKGWVGSSGGMLTLMFRKLFVVATFWALEVLPWPKNTHTMATKPTNVKKNLTFK